MQVGGGEQTWGKPEEVARVAFEEVAVMVDACFPETRLHLIALAETSLEVGGAMVDCVRSPAREAEGQREEYTTDFTYCLPVFARHSLWAKHIAISTPILNDIQRLITT
jgi:hypothetical protein